MRFIGSDRPPAAASAALSSLRLSTISLHRRVSVRSQNAGPAPCLCSTPRDIADWSAATGLPTNEVKLPVIPVCNFVSSCLVGSNELCDVATSLMNEVEHCHNGRSNCLKFRCQIVRGCLLKLEAPLRRYLCVWLTPW